MTPVGALRDPSKAARLAGIQNIAFDLALCLRNADEDEPGLDLSECPEGNPMGRCAPEYELTFVGAGGVELARATVQQDGLTVQASGKSVELPERSLENLRETIALRLADDAE